MIDSAPQLSSQPARPGRIHGLDALRAGALLLGILLHSLMPFAVGIPWLVSDVHTGLGPLLIIYLLHLFRMVVFMLLAGYFGALVVHRRGAGDYLKDRFLRILLPVPVFWPLVVLPLGLLSTLYAMRGGTPVAMPEAEGLSLLLLAATPGQLWFLLTLVECAVLVALGRVLLLRLVGEPRCARVAGALARVLSGPTGVLIAAVPYWACLLIQGSTLGGIIAPQTVIPEPGSLIAYLGAFSVGWLLFARADSMSRIARHWPQQLSAAVVLSVAGLFLSEAVLPLPLAAAITALSGWTWAYALIGVCTRFLGAERPAIRYLADASYWMYLLHLPLLVGFEVLIFDAPWPMMIKLLLTWTVVGAVLLGSYHLLVRRTFIGRWLNGRVPAVRSPREARSVLPR